jgi:hypothetical protein
MRNDIVRFLKQEPSPDTFFTTMIDLYGIHGDFPQLSQAESLRRSVRERVAFLEECFANDIGDHRFIPYIQLHEFEALLFVDPTAFRSYYQNCEQQITRLQAIADGYQSPEEINDGPSTAPSKRVIEHFPDYAGAKPTAGPQIVEHIGLQAIRHKCPHFDEWLTRLENLGK